MKEKVNAQVIEDFIKEHALSKKEFCKLCGISPYIFNKMMKDKEIVYCRSFIKIARATHLKFAQLYVKKDG